MLTTDTASRPQAQKDRLAASDPGQRFSVLIQRGYLSPADLEVAVSMARAQRREIAGLLIDRFGVPKDEVVRALSEFYGSELFEFDGTQSIPAALRLVVSHDFWRTHRCAPLERRGDTVVLALANPLDQSLVDRIEALDIAPFVELRVALESDILDYLDNSYRRNDGSPAVERGVSGSTTHGPSRVLSRIDTRDSTAVSLLDRILEDGCRMGASDIHVEPGGPSRPCLVRFRRDGECFPYLEVPSALRTSLVSRIKVMAGLDIAEKRKPQDGKIRFQLSEGDQESTVELRVVTLPTTGRDNEDVVLRILGSNQLVRIHELGLSQHNLEELLHVVRRPYGLFLCVGPTGSGKTTTLHSVLSYLNRDGIKIWTAEDPVEITQPGLRQVQVQPKIGLTFQTALRSFLRADPDIIMVGEMRDPETTSVAVEASLTGHLVLSTLHTNSAAETVGRLLDLGLDPYNFADSLLGVLAQRLVRTLCEHCKEPYRPSDLELEELREAYGGDPDGRLAEPPRLFRPRGCEQCGGKGLLGRMAIHELLVIDDELRRMITRRRQPLALLQAAQTNGMRTLMQDGIDRVLAGQTDLRQVRAVCSR